MKKSLFLLLLNLLVWLRPEDSWGQADKITITASLDIARQYLSGPSYDKFAKSNDVLTFNALMLVNPLAAFFLLDYGYAARHKNTPADLSTLLASTANHPGPTAPDPAPKASFLSHVYPLIGVQIIGKGGKYNDGVGTSTTRITYLEIPMYAMYGYKLPDDKGRVFGGLGPYIGVGLFGKTTYKDSRTNESYAAFDKNSGGYKRFDAGLNFMAGYQLPQGLSLSLVREIGLVNIDSGNSADKTFNRVWSLNVGYPLDKIVSKLKKK